ncbi:MAG TPA: oxidoreductase [Stellaceae bacterium]|nr:oxidoreductase [Stellaceae bacterium]
MKKKPAAKCTLRNLSVAVLMVAMAAATAWASPTGKMGPMNAPPPHNELAPDAPFLVHGNKVYLQSLKGQPIMVWQVTTWCPSCRAGLETLAQHKSLIDNSKLKIIVLRDYKNGGYPGDDMEKFAEDVAPALLHDPHFVFGEDTETLFKLYNPRHYIDVYQLIAPNGQVAVRSSTPSATFDKIEHFIKTKAGP